MTVEVLISAMYLKDFSIFEKSNCQTDLLIINQTDKEDYEEKIIDGHKVRMYSTTQRGLSRSRNMAIIHAMGDYCIFADDDEQLVKDYEKLIINAFKRNPEASIIAFNYGDPNVRLKASAKKIIKVEKEAPKTRSFSSVSIAFNREKIIRTAVWFNVNLGAGSDVISAGEESAWEQLARDKGLKLFQCPDFITEVTQENSTWFSDYNEKYFYDLGANLTVRYSIKKYLYQFYYLFRLHGETELKWYTQLYYLNAGMSGFSKGLSYENYISQKK